MDPPPIHRRTADECDGPDQHSQTFQETNDTTFLNNYSGVFPDNLPLDQDLFAGDLWSSAFVPDVLHSNQPFTADYGLAPSYEPSSSASYNTVETIVGTVAAQTDFGESRLYQNLPTIWPQEGLTASHHTNILSSHDRNQFDQSVWPSTLQANWTAWSNNGFPPNSSQNPPPIASSSIHDAGGSQVVEPVQLFEPAHEGGVGTLTLVSTDIPVEALPANMVSVGKLSDSLDTSELQTAQLIKGRRGKNKRSAARAQGHQVSFTIITVNPVTGSLQGKISKPRRAFEDNRRKEVAEVRKMGACFRCKMWNTGVS